MIFYKIYNNKLYKKLIMLHPNIFHDQAAIDSLIDIYSGVTLYYNIINIIVLSNMAFYCIDIKIN